MCLLRDDKSSSLRHHHCLVNIYGEFFNNNCLLPLVYIHSNLRDSLFIILS